jgi:hypothetical protein
MAELGTSPPTTISLLHATFHRSGGLTPVIDAWLNSAHAASRIEYVIAADDDDAEAAAAAADPRVRLVVNSPDPTWSTAVRNWNAAARTCVGDLLVVIADDLFPPPLWDSELDRICSSLDPLSDAFAIKVQDSDDPHDVLMRHPVVSRRFVELHGLFDPGFTGVYCDNDITLRAFWYRGIVDGRRLRWDHRHGSATNDVAMSPSHRRINRRVEYERGQTVLSSNWPDSRRSPTVVLVSPEALARRPWSYASHRARFRASLNHRYAIVQAAWRRATGRAAHRSVSRPAEPSD